MSLDQFHPVLATQLPQYLPNVAATATTLVWLIGDGGERSNFQAVQTRVKDLLRTHCIDWRYEDFESLVRLVEQGLRARLEEAQSG